MKLRPSPWLVALVSVAGCGGQDSFQVSIEFPDQAARDQTELVRVVVMLPEEGAQCAPLLDGSASPDESGYPIEDLVEVEYPPAAAPRPLAVVGPGRRLFLAEGEDDQARVILRGCVEAVAGGDGGVHEVTILLAWVPLACEQDCSELDGPCQLGVCHTETGECQAEPREDGWTCDDGLHCTDPDTCEEGACQGATRDCDDEDACTQDGCDEGAGGCTNVLTPVPGAEGPPGDESCENGLDDDCDRLTDLSDPDCIACVTDEQCADGNPCTQDLCTDTVCSNPDEPNDTQCDDGLACFEDESCQGGRCLGVDRDCDDLDPCTQDLCVEPDGHCDHPPVTDPGTEGPPGDESCFNGLDDDCDGLTDLAGLACFQPSNVSVETAGVLFDPQLQGLDFSGSASLVIVDGDDGSIEDDQGHTLREPGEGWSAGVWYGLELLPGGPGLDAAVFGVRSLDIPAGVTVLGVGSHPIVVLVREDASIAGAIDMGARRDPAAAVWEGDHLAGPGGGAGGADMAPGLGGCGGGAAAGGEYCAEGTSGGGGGGGFGGSGGPGGDGSYPDAGCNTIWAGGTSGGTCGLDDLVPLSGGSGGGGGGLATGGASDAGQGGAGGGAFQLTALGVIHLSGVVTAPGGGGGGASQECGGGGGGGSGGAILLEASEVIVEAGGVVAANGGGGGSGDCL